METQYDATLETLEKLRAESIDSGGKAKRDAQHHRGKLTARERIDLLLDDGSFEEFDVLKIGRGALWGMSQATRETVSLPATALSTAARSLFSARILPLPEVPLEKRTLRRSVK